jgi:hypothetical protein
LRDIKGVRLRMRTVKYARAREVTCTRPRKTAKATEVFTTEEETARVTIAMRGATMVERTKRTAMTIEVFI